MLTRNSAGVAHRNDADAREIDQLGGTVNFTATLNRKPFQAIRAELAGSTQCEAAEGINADSLSPVLELCRLLLAAGHDPDRPLKAWRGDTLCLRIRSIGEAARLRVATHGVGFQCAPECTAAPPARKSAFPHPITHDSGATAMTAPFSGATEKRKAVITTSRAADMMRSGGTLVQMHSKDCLRWYIVPGGEVTERVAKELLARPDVQPSNDGLFPGISQTFRLRGVP